MERTEIRESGLFQIDLSTGHAAKRAERFRGSVLGYCGGERMASSVAQVAQPAVAQAASLRWWNRGGAWPTGSRRYGRLAVCGTDGRFMERTVFQNLDTDWDHEPGSEEDRERPSPRPSPGGRGRKRTEGFGGLSWGRFMKSGPIRWMGSLCGQGVDRGRSVRGRRRRSIRRAVVRGRAPGREARRRCNSRR